MQKLKLTRNSAVLVRAYKPSDRASLIYCINGLHADLVSKDPLNRGRKINPMGRTYVSQALSRLRKSGGRFFLAISQEKVVGAVMGFLGKDKDGSFPMRFGHVTDLFVDKAFRSRGLGTLLMDRMEDYFKALGCQAIFVDVLSFNPGARRLYLRRGYRERIVTLIRLLD